MLRLLPYARRSGGKLVLSMVLLIPLSVAGAVQPVLVQRGIDGPIATGDLVGLRWLCLWVFVTIALRLALQSWQGYLVQQVGQKNYGRDSLRFVLPCNPAFSQFL
jgi:ATP-binding cassette subfamily B protein